MPNLKECKVLLVYCIKIKNVTFWNACYSQFFEFQNLKKSSNLFKTAILAVNNIKSVHFQQSNFGAYEDTLSKLQENWKTNFQIVGFIQQFKFQNWKKLHFWVNWTIFSNFENQNGRISRNFEIWFSDFLIVYLEYPQS